MATDLLDPATVPSLLGDDLPVVYEPEEMVIPVRDVLYGVVGSLTGVEVGRVDAETLAWAGVDATGCVRSGTMRPRFEVDGGGITIDWEVEVDDG
jgi:hypothetical protein